MVFNRDSRTSIWVTKEMADELTRRANARGITRIAFLEELITGKVTSSVKRGRPKKGKKPIDNHDKVCYNRGSSANQDELSNNKLNN